MKNWYEYGLNVDVVESVLVHPTHTDGLAKSGDPVVVGVLVGVNNADADTTASTCVITRRGVFNVPVFAHNAGGNSAVAVGDQLYIDGATAVISKDATKTPFGIALGAVTSGSTVNCLVAL